MQGRRSNAGEPAIGGRRGVRARRRLGWSAVSLGMGAAMAVFALASHGLSAKADTTGTYSGDAYAVGILPDSGSGGLLGLLGTQKIVEAGPLPSTGGTVKNDVLPCTNIPPSGTVLIHVCAVNEKVSGSGPLSTATSRIANVQVLPGSVPCGADPTSLCSLLGVDLLNASAQVNCTGQSSRFEVGTLDEGAPNSGNVLKLTVLGQSAELPNAPQDVPVGSIATIHVIQNSHKAAGNISEVNSISIDFPSTSPLAAVVGSGKINISHAEADLTNCHEVPPSTTTTPPGSTGGSSSGGVAGLPNTSSGSGFGLGAGVSILLLLAAPPAVIGARIARRRIRRHDQS